MTSESEMLPNVDLLQFVSEMKSFEEGVVSEELSVDLVCCFRVDVYSDYTLRIQLLGIRSGDEIQKDSPWNFTISWNSNSFSKKNFVLS